MSGGPLRDPKVRAALSRLDTPGKVRRAARPLVGGKKLPVKVNDTDERVAVLETDLATIKAALKAAGLM